MLQVLTTMAAAGRCLRPGDASHLFTESRAQQPQDPRRGCRGMRTFCATGSGTITDPELISRHCHRWEPEFLYRYDLCAEVKRFVLDNDRILF